MKKYILLGLMAIMVTTTTPVVAAQPVQMNAEAKAALIKELTLKLNELIIELNALVAGQDARIKSEVSNSRVSAEIYYTIDSQRGYAGACKDVTKRIYDSLALTKSNLIPKSTNVSCFDSKENYALSIKTSKGYSCADSTGVIRETAGPTVGVACPVK